VMATVTPIKRATVLPLVRKRLDHQL
jgi:hypothetical protein